MTVSTLPARPGWLSGRPRHLPSMRCCPSETDPSIIETIRAGREAVRVASLASTDQTSTADPLERCPRSTGRVVVELHTGQVFPDRCRSNGCPYCLPRNARRRCLAITLAGPQRMIRFSWVARSKEDDICKLALKRINRTREYMKRAGLDPGEWCFTLEKNPRDTGFHAHCLQVGGYVPQDRLQDFCQRAGAGIPYINAIKRTGIWTSRYGLKGFGAEGYGLKTFRPNANSTEAFRINNGRLEHHSRGFYNFDGEVLRVRDMERAAIATMNADKPIAFLGMRGEDVQRVMANRRLVHRLIMQVNQRSASLLRAIR